MEWINALYQLFAFTSMIGIFAALSLFIRSHIRRTKQLQRIERELKELKTEIAGKKPSPINIDND